MEQASAFKTWFQPGPRPAWGAFNHAGFINQELTSVNFRSPCYLLDSANCQSRDLRLMQQTCRHLGEVRRPQLLHDIVS